MDNHDTSECGKEHAMKRSIGAIITFMILTSLFFIAGCSYVSVETRQYLGVPTYAPSDPSKIEILTAQPSRPAEKLGEIILQPQGNPPKEEMERKLREAASKLGADAAVIVADKTKLMGGYVSGPWWNGEIIPQYGRVIIAVAIRYKQQ